MKVAKDSWMVDDESEVISIYYGADTEEAEAEGAGNGSGGGLSGL